MFFTHPLITKNLPPVVLEKYEAQVKNKAFEIFHDKCYRALNLVPGGDTHEDQVIKIIIMKYFYLE